MGDENETVHDRWARLRFPVVGPLLAAKVWRHSVTGEPVRFAQSTIERWYYAARAEAHDPVGVLRRRVRKDAGQARGVSLELGQATGRSTGSIPAGAISCTRTICACGYGSTRSWARCPPTPRSAAG